MLSKFIYYLTIAFLLTACHRNINNPAKNISELGLIPQPQKIALQKYAFLYDANTPFVIDKKADDHLVEEVKNLFSTNQIHRHKDGVTNKTIRLVIDSTGFDNKEAYHLRVNPDEILISAGESQGLFYGLQTLRQLFPENINPVADTIPALIITDAPQFAWRGLHLDVSRHFFDVAFIKKYIDLLAKHKMNTFHWHLVDDQGWRIEIKQYPKLTSIGSMRKETVVKKHFKPYIGDGKPYGGYYTQDDIKEVVAYAKSKYITVVPEIEMPGHSIAALAAYPQFSCTGGPFEVTTKWGIFKDVYCAGNDSTFIFLENILDEVMALFPSKYIHIGGDEVPKDRWVVCQKCQQRIKDEHLKDTPELQSYFIKRIEKYVHQKGRQIIGWDEILEGGLAPGASVMSWRGEKGGIIAAKQNHNVVMTPMKPCYFDHYQSKDRTHEPFAIGGFNPLKAVYNYQPLPHDLPSDKNHYILGAQANVWTEYMTTPKHVEYMVYPRASALSEVLWTDDNRQDYNQFHKRLKRHLNRLAYWNVHYRPLDSLK